MRKISFAFRVAGLVAVFTVSAIGQQQPDLYLAKSIELPAEPAEAPHVVTLADAARSNNYPLFDAMYAQAGDEAARFAELHTFWQWSMTDPIGGWYGEEVHARLASEYPDFAAYIADYGVIDSHGNAFYPSAETRRFLLEQAVEGRAPVVRVAKVTARKKTTTKPAIAHKVSAPKPVVAHVAPAPVPVPAPVVAVTVPQPKPQVVSGGAAAVPAAVARDARRSTAPVRAAATSENDYRLARGFALIVAGLLAVGMLTVMLRTPREEMPDGAKEEPIEPLRIIPLEERKPKKTA